ncbi:MAG: hypothetical protein E7576_14850 [Ruminococcaceae bacterium]|jgi:ABC-type glycerol-3-phosphate transport system substrate-binding protein/predicted heme/steroid binding protein|nr:hypothetical protein [Oscillospiraceae bacterium]
MKKLLALSLALLLLVSCAQNAQNADPAADNTAVPEDPASSETAAEEKDEDDFSEYLPSADYEGYEFCILKSPDITWCLDEVWTEGVTGEAYTDAIYNRNSRIEDLLNIKISQFDGGVDGAIKSSVTAGDDVYSIAYPSLSSAASLGAQDLLVDLKQLSEFHIDMPWWDQAAMDYLTVANRLFFAENEINIQYDEATWVLFFNKDLVTRYAMESPYELVRENEWTMDRMHGMMTTVAHDEDGNGELNAPEDYFGFSTHWGSYVGMLSGAGESLVLSDGEGSYVSNFGSERMLLVSEKIGAILNDKTATVLPDRFKGASVNNNEWAVNTFYNGHSLFYGEVIGKFADLREMENDFGLLPFPKYETVQEFYTCEVLNSALAYVIPRSVQDKSRSATISEALAVDSHGDFMNAYLDTTITGKSIRDEDSREMLQIIFEYRVYDLGDIFGWGGITGAYQNAVDAGSENFASSAKKIEKIFNKSVEKSLTAYEEADGT